MKLKAILVGKTKKYKNEKREWESGYAKKPIKGFAEITKLTIIDDEVADKKHHGGVDKAILVYSFNHYEKWKKELNLENIDIGSFGENFLIDGLDENNVSVGDIYQLDEVIVEVSQPRQPCWKIGNHFNDKSMLPKVLNNSRTGWYLRILKEGKIDINSTIKLIKKPYPELTIKKLNDLLKDKSDKILIDKILNLDVVAEAYKKDLIKNG